MLFYKIYDTIINPITHYTIVISYNLQIIHR